MAKSLPASRFNRESGLKADIVQKSNIGLSFQYVNFDDHFFLHGLKNTYFEKLFEAIHELTILSIDRFKQGDSPLKPKKIDWSYGNTTRDEFPVKETLNDSQRMELRELMEEGFEFRVLTKGMGRIHGFLTGTIFCVVWFDPAHNLIPTNGEKIRDLNEFDKNRCRAHTIEELAECRERIPVLEAEIERLKRDLQACEELTGLSAS